MENCVAAISASSAPDGVKQGGLSCVRTLSFHWLLGQNCRFVRGQMYDEQRFMIDRLISLFTCMSLADVCATLEQRVHLG